MRFAIKNRMGKALKEMDGTIIRFSGSGEPFYKSSMRDGGFKGVNEKGEPVISYVTGLDTTRVRFFKWYTAEDQVVVTKTIEDLRKDIEDYYGGGSVVNDRNTHFWGQNRDVARLSLTHEDIDVFYDTKNPPHALLYLSVISGAFMDLVAPTKEWAERHNIDFYILLETEDTESEDDEDVTRSDAHAALSELKREESNEALFILAWCLQYDTNAFGAYRKSASIRDLVNYHIKYIDGKLVTKRKRNMPKTFMEYAERWKGQQTRPALYTEAYVKAGEYFNLISKKEKKFTTSDGTALGNSIQEAVDNLQKVKFRADFEALREKVEAKWME
jgi:hypothetical protein